MIPFKYVVQDPHGKTLKGVLEVDERSSLIELFREKKYRVVSVDPASQLDLIVQRILDQLGGIKREHVIIFTRQLSTLIHSGLPLSQALESLAWQERNSRFKTVIEMINSDIKKGRTLKEALGKFPNLFSNLYLGMIESGEAAGILDQVLERLSQIGIQELEVRTKIQAAFTYPIILIIVALVVVVFLLVGAVPKFLDIFKSSNAELPLATTILLNISSFLNKFWYVLAGAIGVGGWFCAQYYNTKPGRLFFDNLILRLPVFGQLYLKVMVARLTRTISALTKSGIPLLKALEIGQGILSNVVLLNAVDGIRVGVSQGKSLTDLFQGTEIFPPMVIQMVSVGESTGKLDDMLSEVADFYETELEYILRNITSSLEPILLLFMGLMVGFIALAVLMPVFNLVKVFR